MATDKEEFIGTVRFSQSIRSPRPRNRAGTRGGSETKARLRDCSEIASRIALMSLERFQIQI
jgi:hypothetical protein